MEHNHEHHHHISYSSNLNKVFFISIGLNLAFTIIEFTLGYLNNSLALIADATHNLSDVASLAISLIGLQLSKKIATLTYTYGYKKASILASLINSVILISIVVGIIKEAVERFQNPAEVHGQVIILTAFIGIIVNTISALLFYKDQKKDINLKGAFLHLMIDALLSLGVVISGVIIYFTDWFFIDPIISIVVALVIVISSWKLLRESVKLTLDGVPRDIDVDEVKKSLMEINEVIDVHHIHIWAISSTLNAFSGHFIVEDTMTISKLSDVKHSIVHKLEHFNIKHSTVEFESEKNPCDDTNC